MLSVKNLEVTYPDGKNEVYAVSGISFNLNEGESFGIVGESGAGKSVTCKTVMNMLEDTAITNGEIYFKGTDFLNISRKHLKNYYADEISLLPQSSTSLNPLLTIGRHIKETISAHNSGINNKKLKAKALDLLAQFQLSNPEHVYRSYPFQLSGGMMQRVLLAITFSCSPSLVVVDEPTKGLDLILKKQVIESLKEIKRNVNTAMLIVTHDLDVAYAICDRIGIIYSGIFMELGSTEKVLSNPMHPYTQVLINALPSNGMKSAPGYAPSSIEKQKGCPFQKRCPYCKELKTTCFGNYPVEISPDHMVWCKYAAD